jgi:hypothetical protein
VHGGNGAHIHTRLGSSNRETGTQEIGAQGHQHSVWESAPCTLHAALCMAHSQCTMHLPAGAGKWREVHAVKSNGAS